MSKGKINTLADAMKHHEKRIEELEKARNMLYDDPWAMLDEFIALDINNLLADEKTTVDEWLSINIEQHQIKKYPNAKVADELKSSPLYKALK